MIHPLPRPRPSSHAAKAVNAATRPGSERRHAARTGAAATTARAISELAVRMTVLCESAVDPWEITAGLEAHGINDKIARSAYGVPDVFTLADILYKRVPRRPLITATGINPWRGGAGHHLLRGVLFGLPGICYVAASQSLAGRGAAVTIVVSLVLSWAVSEAMSYLGYSRLGQLDASGSARILRCGLAIGLLVLIPVTAAAGWALGAGASATAFAAGQSAYLLAATVVLVSGAERWLLAALVPGALASAGFLLTGRTGTPPWVWAASGATVVATLALALVLTRSRKDAAAPRPVRLADVWSAVPHGAFGLLAGGLLTFATLSAVLGGAGSPGIAVLPISLTMGAAEWLLFRYRRRTHTLLHARASLHRFSLSARIALIGAVGGYLGVLTLTAGSVVAIGRVTGGYAARPEAILGSLALGGAMFLALLLRSCGATVIVLTGFALALAGEAGIRWLPGGQLSAESGELMAPVALFALLLIYAITVLGRATRHR